MWGSILDVLAILQYVEYAKCVAMCRNITYWAYLNICFDHILHIFCVLFLHILHIEANRSGPVSAVQCSAELESVVSGSFNVSLQSTGGRQGQRLCSCSLSIIVDNRCWASGRDRRAGSLDKVLAKLPKHVLRKPSLPPISEILWSSLKQVFIRNLALLMIQVSSVISFFTNSSKACFVQVKGGNQKRLSMKAWNRVPIKGISFAVFPSRFNLTCRICKICLTCKIWIFKLNLHSEFAVQLLVNISVGFGDQFGQNLLQRRCNGTMYHETVPEPIYLLWCAQTMPDGKKSINMQNIQYMQYMQNIYLCSPAGANSRLPLCHH